MKVVETNWVSLDGQGTQNGILEATPRTEGMLEYYAGVSVGNVGGRGGYESAKVGESQAPWQRLLFVVHRQTR